MNKTTNANILTSLEKINDTKLILARRRINIYDTNTDGEYFVEVELLRRRDFRTWRRFAITYGVSEDAALLAATVARKCFVEENRELTEDELVAISKREKRIRRRERKMKKHNSTEDNND